MCIIWEVETIQFNDGSYATVHEDLYKESGTKITDNYFTPFQLKGKIFHGTRQGCVEVTGVGHDGYDVDEHWSDEGGYYSDKRVTYHKSIKGVKINVKPYLEKTRYEEVPSGTIIFGGKVSVNACSGGWVDLK